MPPWNQNREISETIRQYVAARNHAASTCLTDTYLRAVSWRDQTGSATASAQPTIRKMHSTLGTRLFDDCDSSVITITHYWLKQLPVFLNEIRDRLEELRSRQDNWDQQDSKKVRLESLNRAYAFLPYFLELILDDGYVWRRPFISSNEDGNVTVEWHKGKHELHIVISEKCEEYMQVWGVNIDNEMYSGVLAKEKYVELWDWLVRG